MKRTPNSGPNQKVGYFSYKVQMYEAIGSPMNMMRVQIVRM